MAVLIQITSLMALKLSHLYRKYPGGPYYYRRKIPQHALSLYPSNQTHVKVALKTKDPIEAARKAEALSAADDVRWASTLPDQFGRYPTHHPAIRTAALRLLDDLKVQVGHGFVMNRMFDAVPTEQIDDYLERKYGRQRVYDAHENGWEAFLNSIEPVDAEAYRLFWINPDEDKKRPLVLSEAAEIYLREHKRGSDQDFRRTTLREVNSVIQIIGDKPLTEITRDDARAFRDSLLKTMKTASARRRLNTVSAIINRALHEQGLPLKNQFEKLVITGENDDSAERVPFTAEEIKTVAAQCLLKDDDIRHIIALLIDTGSRISEIVGLRRADVDLTSPVPFVHIKPNEGRSLKTSNSERKVPLVGISLWAAKRAIDHSKDDQSGYLFPRYFDVAKGKVQGTHASNTANKWLRSATESTKTSHSFRHSMRDRLREAGVEQEIQDVIGGWGSRSIGQKYGSGHGLTILRDALAKVATPVDGNSQVDAARSGSKRSFAITRPVDEMMLEKAVALSKRVSKDDV